MSSHYIDAEGQTAWIAEHADLPQATVAAVLELEFEYMIAVGIVDVPGHEFHYYRPDELSDAPPEVDCDRLAQDAELILGIPTETANKVFDTESQFLQMRGLVDGPDPPDDASARDIGYELEGPKAAFPAVWLWTDRYIPFERLSPAQLAARSELRRRLRSLLPEVGEILHASYAGFKPANADVENLLLYNIDMGGACFLPSVTNGLRFELAAPPRRDPPSGREYPCSYEYRMTQPSPHFTHWRPARPLATFSNATLGVFGPARRLEQTWIAVRQADAEIADEALVSNTPFATVLRLRAPHGVRVALRPELIKSLVDGVVAGFQAHRDPATIGDVSLRIATTLPIESDRIAQILTDRSRAVLGVVNRLVHLRDPGVQWNPSDHMCVAGEVLLEKPIGNDWRLDGELWALEPVEP